ncbi:MAG TPA: GNAT family N-acetyltransferase [Burkholderiaceae bacterium]|nr:GNAT family N-acetyltransferase [Burkholderiaceae bacterium]
MSRLDTTPDSIPAATSATHDKHPSLAAAPSWAWVPIRSLGPRHRERIGTHLLALGPHDRYLRFGYAASDAQIARYVDTLDFEQDEVFGIFNRRLELIAMAHLAHAVGSPQKDGRAESEFGVSVLAQARNRGFGRRLFEHAMLHARNRGVQTLLIHALSENNAMLKIARNAGATVVREGSESDARLRLPPDSLASHVGELIEQQAAEFDYRIKRRARQVSELLDVIGDVKSALGKSTHVAEE